MFTFDFEEAQSCVIKRSQDIIVFDILLENARKLSVYYVTDFSIMYVLENICLFRDCVIEHCSAKGFKYSCLIGVSYVL